MRASELLRNKFGVSQLYRHEVKEGDETVLEVYWHPLTIAERESIQKKVGPDDAGDFALSLMIEKRLTLMAKGFFRTVKGLCLKRSRGSCSSRDPACDAVFWV
ncbi:hypothetical protein [uncultured phage MedDCM-OCT-S05-C353]|nr:hypothetical protein [uncultured phage MedDCM-OCT-S05-C353]